MRDEYIYVAGWKDLSLVDVIEATSFTVWMNFCNFNCPWCSNAHVAKGLEKKKIRIIELYEKVREASDFIDYFHVTGGEPTLQPKALYKIFKMIYDNLDLPNSLDTNGSNPEYYSKVVNMIKHVAIDIKAPFSKPWLYAKSIGLNIRAVNFFIPRIKKSLDISLDVDFFELRTTLVPNIIGEEETLMIARDLLPIVNRGKKRIVFVIQQFIPYSNIASEEYRNTSRTPPDLVIDIAKKVAEILPIEIYHRTLEYGTKKCKVTFSKVRHT